MFFWVVQSPQSIISHLDMSNLGRKPSFFKNEKKIIFAGQKRGGGTTVVPLISAPSGCIGDLLQ